jgi:hypothetical protein
MSARWRVLGAALGVVLALVAAAAPVAAQRPGQRPTTQPTTPRRPDTTRTQATRRAPGDTTGGLRDTTERELVTWVETDSVMEALLARPGYSATRYQGSRITFEARDRTLFIEGKPSAVMRGEAILRGDTIVYNDSLQLVQVRSDSAFLRDPSQQADDVFARGYLEYDLRNRIGTVRELSTVVESGQRWFVHGKGGAQFRNDTSAARRSAFYVRNGELTSCEHLEPHYHFAAQEIKMVARNVLVARPAVLYIGNVPVMWLPFIFQDLRSGRRSGIITPRFGIAELVRNGPTYRRQVDNFGYYWAISDFMDATAAVDWRSSARGTSFDPGYLRYNGDWQYKWIDRFLSGSMRASHDRWRDGRRSTTVAWSHQQAFSQRTNLNANLQYSTNSQLIRQGSQDPYQAFSTIRSDANFQTGIGPLNVALGGNRTQYTTRPEVNLGFPTLSLTTTGPISVGDWLTWTPSLNLNNTLTTDQELTSTYRFVTRADGGIDSLRTRQDVRNTQLSVNTPLRIFDFDLNNAFTITEQETNGPQPFTVYPNGDTIPERRVFNRTFSTQLGYDPNFALPRILQGSWNITPSVSLRNVQSGGFGVRTHFTGGDWVFQRKRPSFGVSSTPTFFGLFPGIGPVSRFRHALNPQFGWSYSPDATRLFSAEFARAFGQSGRPDLSVLPQNQLTFGLNQSIEAKLRSGADTSLEGGRKIKLLALNTSPLAYDFVRADTIGRGLVTESFQYDIRSDLLPGFDFRAQYSLFEGSSASDTARFKPYRTSVGANLSLNANSAIILGLARLFGRRGPAAEDIETDPNASAEQTLVATQVAAQRVAGTGSRTSPMGVANPGQGWNLTLSYSEQKSRPIRGGNVVYLDVNQQCAQYFDPLAVQACRQNVGNTAGLGQGADSAFAGRQIVIAPPARNIQGQTSFNITPKWSAQWGTQYDLVRKEFGLHQVSLQRELHDWRAIFAFTQSPTGAFAFNFFISLNAQPDIKFDYNRRSYPRGTGAFR